MEAIAKVPDRHSSTRFALVGPRERVAERLEAWKASPVTTLLIQATTLNTLRTMAELLL
jgi:alkanesulfonate monooxygenase SsuD/methylene tetrahydromethanopterin reductase-like flavin-dependent oxidoreductase (luciferase family)